MDRVGSARLAGTRPPTSAAFAIKQRVICEMGVRGCSAIGPPCRARHMKKMLVKAAKCHTCLSEHLVRGS